MEIGRVERWVKERVKQDEIDKYLDQGNDFIPDVDIEREIASAKPDPKKVKDILQKSMAVETLTLQETAALLNVRDPEVWEEMEHTAGLVKKKVYDNRIVTFAPLYLGNLCVNNCVYCGFRSSNDGAKRQILTLDEVKKETETLAGKIGHKRLIVVYGEHPDTGVEYMEDTIRAIYSTKVKTKNGEGAIRRVNVNAAPMPVAELRRLHEVGIGTYQVFQETYHRDTYKRLHPKGTLKADYRWRLYCMHRAIEAGIDDVGLGVLFGLYDWRFEVMGLVAHSMELEKKFGIGAHTVSFPRLEPAHNTPFLQKLKYAVSDEDFRKILIAIRLAVPHAGMILTARESADIRRKFMPLGITQIDASSKIGIGAYSDGGEAQKGEKQQFFLGDTRSLDEVIRELAEKGMITSFCTAGYRCGRTGECIMELLRSGREGQFCKLNAVLTFREWLDDFASPETREAGEKVINKELEEVCFKMPEIYPELVKNYNRIKSGERDLYF
ncbi:MAG TPA: [FeFe] hydrogenase H-cluster radical SAM maturase HydG [Candidatus Omnitrophota bacterium]|nr:[FeFe] hydrogenase H-cluster radical SAM maturase HydG [Candidatus Omnitrophota bacterium]